MPDALALPLLKDRVREALTFDLGVFRAPAGAAAYAAGRLLVERRDPVRGYELLSRVHRMGLSEGFDRRIEARVRGAVHGSDAHERAALQAFLDTSRRTAIASYRKTGRGANPEGLLGSRMLVVKSSGEREKGVIIADYSYVFFLMPELFDVPAILDRYYLVLEPSWSGFFTPEVLQFALYDAPIFVESSEPRDAGFVGSLEANLQPIPISANWWVDYRLFTPRPYAERDIDIVMVAGWADFKRHWRFFKALGELRRRGHRPRTVLIGYPNNKTRQDIEAEARHFGVHDQIELFERIPPAEVGALLARSKMHVLWSRREGVNRAIIESMFAGTPVIVREGFNYGYRYPFINDATGRFANEGTLGDAILELLDRGANLAPRDWVMAHMTCQHATAIVEDAARQTALARGEPWTHGLVVKTASLDTQQYWEPKDRERFATDYRYLARCLRSAS